VSDFANCPSELRQWNRLTQAEPPHGGHEFAPDSALEGDGFELPVPRGKKSVSHWIR
jgi:hypothetical protein